MSRNRCAVLMFLAVLSMMFVTLVVGGCATTRPAAVEESTVTTTTPECPEGFRYSLREGFCEPLCNYDSGEKWDPSTKGCISICGPGYKWASGFCVSLCKGETVWNSATSSCECPTGKFPTEQGLCMTRDQLETERAKAIKAAVERGATMNVQFDALRAATKAERDKAEAERPKCPPGQKFDDNWGGLGSGQCITICKGGTWDNAQATCNCPPGKFWWTEIGECVDNNNIPPTSMVDPDFDPRIGTAQEDYEETFRKAQEDYEETFGKAVDQKAAISTAREQRKAAEAEERALRKAAMAVGAEVRTLNRAITAAEIQRRKAEVAAEAHERAAKRTAEAHERAAKRTAEAHERAAKRVADAEERALNRALEASARALEARDRALEALCKAKKGTWEKRLLRCE